MKRLTALIAVLLTACSGSKSDDNQPTDDSIPSQPNAAQVAYTGPSEYIPTLKEVFVTDNQYWVCGFASNDGLYWQIAAYFNPNNSGSVVYSYGYNGYPAPDPFLFDWSGEQALSVLSGDISATLFNFVFETDPDIATPNSIYQFTAQTSDGSLALCNKYPGQW